MFQPSFKTVNKCGTIKMKRGLNIWLSSSKMILLLNFRWWIWEDMVHKNTRYIAWLNYFFIYIYIWRMVVQDYFKSFVSNEALHLWAMSSRQTSWKIISKCRIMNLYMPYKHARLFVKSVFFSDFSYHKMFYEFLSCAAKIDFITFIRTHQKDKILIKTWKNAVSQFRI